MYGLMIINSTERDVEKNTQGFKAYEYFISHKAVQNKAIDMIKHRMKKNTNDILIEDIFNVLISDLLTHDYDPDRAYNEEFDVQMTIENYILRRLGYAISTFIRKDHADKDIEVRTNSGGTYVLTTNVVSINASLDSNNDSTTSLEEVIPDKTSLIDDTPVDAIDADKALIDLAERVSRLAAWSDTNIDVILYATIMLDLLCEANVDKNEVLKQALTALGITNYISAKQFSHNKDFIEICNDVAAIEDKQKFVEILAGQIFCRKEITATLEWIAQEVNKSLYNTKA